MKKKWKKRLEVVVIMLVVWLVQHMFFDHLAIHELVDRWNRQQTQKPPAVVAP